MASDSIIITTSIILFVFIGGVIYNFRSIIVSDRESKFSFIPLYFILLLFIISNYIIGTNIKVEDKSKDELTQDPQLEIEKKLTNYIIVVIFLVLLLFMVFIGGFIFIRKKGY